LLFCPQGVVPDTFACCCISTLEFSCAPTHDSVWLQIFILAAPSHLASSQPTGAISCHVTECCSVIGWSAEWLAVRQVPKPLPSFAEVGMAMHD